MNLNQITVPSTDVPRSVAFYQTLGLRLIVSNFPSYARLECPDGDATFSVAQVAAIAPNPDLVVYFECEDLDRTCATLAAAGIRFDSAPTDQPWLWREAHLRDPDGNVYFACTTLVRIGGIPRGA